VVNLHIEFTQYSCESILFSQPTILGRDSRGGEAEVLEKGSVHSGRLGGGVLPYMGYTGMCGLKGYGFSAVLVINRVWVLHSSLDTFKKKPPIHHYRRENQQKPFTNYVYSNLTSL